MGDLKFTVHRPCTICGRDIERGESFFDLNRRDGTRHCVHVDCAIEQELAQRGMESRDYQVKAFLPGPYDDVQVLVQVEDGMVVGMDWRIGTGVWSPLGVDGGSWEIVP